MRATVLGSGSWGTALAILLARNDIETILVGRSSEDHDAMVARRENLRYLPGFALPRGIKFATFDDDLAETDLWVVAVPAKAVRSVLPRVVGENALVTLAAKGIEPGSAMLMSEVAREVLGENARLVALSGPNLAVEIVRGIPTAAVAAADDLAVADQVRTAFTCSTFRVYNAQDLIGVELAGALKNVLAIGAGVSDGLGFGDNSKGALLARGLYEITRLGLAVGARIETFLGIAGVGDLFATANSRLSRNYRVGYALGQGRTLPQALDEIGQVAEGVTTSEGVLVRGRKAEVPLPVFEAIDGVIRGRLRPQDGVALLMERMVRSDGVLSPEAYLEFRPRVT